MHQQEQNHFEISKPKLM